jgi:hypothetical protein
MRAGTRQEYVILSTCLSLVAEQFTNQSTNKSNLHPLSSVLSACTPA